MSNLFTVLSFVFGFALLALFAVGLIALGFLLIDLFGGWGLALFAVGLGGLAGLLFGLSAIFDETILG